MVLFTTYARPCPLGFASPMQLYAPTHLSSLSIVYLLRNAQVVFKALIVLHTMIRNGATDNVLTYLSSSEVLRLRNVSTGNWEGEWFPCHLIRTLKRMFQQVMLPPSTSKITPSTSIPEYALIKISNTMRWKFRPSLIGICAIPCRLRRTVIEVGKIAPPWPQYPPEARLSWEGNCGRWLLRRDFCERRRLFITWLIHWLNAEWVIPSHLLLLINPLLVLSRWFRGWIDYHSFADAC